MRKVTPPTLLSYGRSALLMKPRDIDALTKQHMQSFEREIEHLYSVAAQPPGFEKFPDEGPLHGLQVCCCAPRSRVALRDSAFASFELGGERGNPFGLRIDACELCPRGVSESHDLARIALSQGTFTHVRERPVDHDPTWGKLSPARRQATRDFARPARSRCARAGRARATTYRQRN